MQLKKPSLVWSALALAITMALTACGGGSDASSPATANSATPGATSTQASAMYAGPISGFGSVIVNGMRFSSVGATLVDDDAQNISLAQLKLGMTLRVTGTTDDTNLLGTASLLELVHGNRGLVTSIDVNAGTLTLLGQTVVTNGATAYQGAAGLAFVTVGQAVEVYGALQADGSLLATLIELKSAITSINLNGHMKNVNANSFQVGNLTVNYATATLKGVPGENKQVKIKAATGPVGNVLSASSVQVFDSDSVFGASIAAGTRMKVKGVAGSAPVNGLLTLSGTQVNVAQAAYKGNAAIAAGQFIEVKGNWDGSVLQATEVEMEGYRDSSATVTERL